MSGSAHSRVSRSPVLLAMSPFPQTTTLGVSARAAEARLRFGAALDQARETGKFVIVPDAKSLELCKRAVCLYFESGRPVARRK